MAKSGDFEAAAFPAASANCYYEIVRAILKAQTDAAANSTKTYRFL